MSDIYFDPYISEDKDYADIGGKSAARYFREMVASEISKKFGSSLGEEFLNESSCKTINGLEGLLTSTNTVFVIFKKYTREDEKRTPEFYSKEGLLDRINRGEISVYDFEIYGYPDEEFYLDIEQ